MFLRLSSLTEYVYSNLFSFAKTLKFFLKIRRKWIILVLVQMNLICLRFCRSKLEKRMESWTIFLIYDTCNLFLLYINVQSCLEIRTIIQKGHSRQRGPWNIDYKQIWEAAGHSRLQILVRVNFFSPVIYSLIESFCIRRDLNLFLKMKRGRYC